MFKLSLTLLTSLVLISGCASSPERRNQIINEAANTIQPTQGKLSTYSKFKLLPMKLTKDISSNSKKLAYSKTIETKLQNKLKPLLQKWSSTKSRRKLSIQPELISLRVVSGGARFWIGAMAGESKIQLRLIIKDVQKNKVIGTPVISKNTGGMSGAWSGGATDRSLVDYIVSIAEQYLINNY